MSTLDLAFRFNARRHEYSLVATGEIIPHITGMLKQMGLVDDRWYTEESSARGTDVHDLTAQYDLGALDVASCVSPHRGYLLAHVQAMSILRPEFLAVEQPFVHPVHRYGGRPDRLLILQGKPGVLEIKATVPTKAHRIQTALQAILVERELGIPPEMIERHCLYLKPNGRFILEAHASSGDFATAREVIQRCCSGGRGSR